MKQRGRAGLEKFNELLKDIKTCILITRSLDGQLDARPMATSGSDEDGTLWFFTNELLFYGNVIF